MATFYSDSTIEDYIRFVNIGNTCYFSAALHIVLHNHHITRILAAIANEPCLAGVKPQTVAELAEQKVEINENHVMHEMVYAFNMVYRAKYQVDFERSIRPKSTSRTALRPINLYRKFILYTKSFEFNRPEDVDDAVMILFRIFETSSFTKLHWKRSLQAHYEFSESTKYKCTNCNHTFVVKAPASIKLNLFLHDDCEDLNGLINKLTEIEEIDDYKCDKCHETVKYCKATQFSNPGEYLLIHINRFANISQKNRNPIIVPQLFAFCDKKYRTKVLVNHIGRTIHHGHYTASIVADRKAIDTDNDKFLILDDDTTHRGSAYSNIMHPADIYMILAQRID